MGRDMLVDGEWRTDVEPTTDRSGAYDRAETSFRDWIRDDPDARFQPDAGRYHLYIVTSMPTACARTVLPRLSEPGPVIDALPDRALTNEEAEGLKQQDGRIVPLSVLKGGDDPFVIYTMAFYRSEAGTVHLLGYSEEADGWVEFDSFPEDEWTVDRQETRVQEWVEDQYGDRFEQGVLDEDSGTVDMG